MRHFRTISRDAAPPPTDNTLAQRLIARAQEQCHGCRTHWRLTTGTFLHRHPRPQMECRAQAIRQQLRDIAAKPRQVKYYPVFCDDVGGGP